MSEQSDAIATIRRRYEDATYDADDLLTALEIIDALQARARKAEAESDARDAEVDRLARQRDIRCQDWLQAQSMRDEARHDAQVWFDAAIKMKKRSWHLLANKMLDDEMRKILKWAESDSKGDYHWEGP